MSLRRLLRAWMGEDAPELKQPEVQVLMLGPLTVLNPSTELVADAIRMDEAMRQSRVRLMFEERPRWH
jgi:hypothetical protein